ncbi:hypothetical protein BVC80_9047g61 [Macleaya cordata]|uniref:Uncharacterized protein n=1 Tax=Macleaya cordata TaxID=56857 RepID=A0A200R2Z0_MACCD|nr:hypothetical protein BVC80_9047g61 [Macleaya cordata]
MVVGTTLLFIAFTSSSSSSSFLPDIVFVGHGSSETAKTFNRKVLEKNYNPSKEKNKRETDNLNLDDYHLIDPVPSSKAAIKSGPIEHGTPLIPYIPKPGSPIHPKHVTSPSPV